MKSLLVDILEQILPIREMIQTHIVWVGNLIG